MHDAGGSGSPPRPAFSPALAVQDHGPGVEVSAAAGSGDGPWFLPIQRAFGPVYLEQIGLGVHYRQDVTPRQLEMISLYLDGQVSLLGLTASVDKLRLRLPRLAPVLRPVVVGGRRRRLRDLQPTSAGSAWPAGCASSRSTRRCPGVEYLGMLKIGFGSYGTRPVRRVRAPDHARPAPQFASFFAFGVLHAPIGGPPAFFITGIGLGFGINRELATRRHRPRSTRTRSCRRSAHSAPSLSPMQQLQQMRGHRAARAGGVLGRGRDQLHQLRAGHRRDPGDGAVRRRARHGDPRPGPRRAAGSRW